MEELSCVNRMIVCVVAEFMAEFMALGFPIFYSRIEEISNKQ